jgi:hypothetical protein
MNGRGSTWMSLGALLATTACPLPGLRVLPVRGDGPSGWVMVTSARSTEVPQRGLHYLSLAVERMLFRGLDGLGLGQEVAVGLHIGGIGDNSRRPRGRPPRFAQQTTALCGGRQSWHRERGGRSRPGKLDPHGQRGVPGPAVAVREDHPGRDRPAAGRQNPAPTGFEVGCEVADRLLA